MSWETKTIVIASEISFEQIYHADAGGEIERAHGLVSQNQIWARNDGPCNGDTLALAPGKTGADSVQGCLVPRPTAVMAFVAICR